jgi:hypothetical protein
VAIPVVAVASFLVWNGMRQVHGVSVDTAVSKFRSTTPSASSAATTPLAKPPTGVYVYDTKGSERISIGKLSHTYPARTTLTMTDGGCGMRVRWAALTERWSEWELCPTPQGWRIRTAIDVHKFLYRQDRQDYVCDDPVVLPHPVTPTWTASCRSKTGELRLTVTKVGTETRTVGGKPVSTIRLHVVDHGTGASTNDGTVEMWLLEPTGLPVRAEVRNHGSQDIVGQLVTYDETATFDLTSTTPRR